MGTLFDIEAKLNRGERLDFDDGMALYKDADLWWLARLAQQFTLSRHGKNVYYRINRHINYTNICRFKCRFCGFSRKEEQADAYVMTQDEVLSQAIEAFRNGSSEVHIVGGVHPDLPFEYYRRVIERIHTSCPRLRIKAFTAVEIIDLAQKGDKTVEETLAVLMKAGLSSLPGGGAEILDEAYFAEICPNKPGPAQWLNVHDTAHRLGLTTNATMLYGYRETIDQRINHLLKLRSQQDISLQRQAGRFHCFVPLPFLPPGQGDRRDRDTNILQDLRTIAVSRLMLDNFDYIKAFWPMLGVQTAQIAMCFGANDLDGTVMRYQIVGQASDKPDAVLSVEEIRTLITQADRVPVEWDI